MRRALLALVVVLSLLVVVDRVAAAVAGRLLADEVQRAGGLAQRPDVDVDGFPFLVQAVRGRYHDIDVRARDVVVGESDGEPVRLDTLAATLSGVRLPLSDVLSGSVTSVPVEQMQARFVLPFDVFARDTEERQLTVAPEDEQLRVSGTVQLLGQEVTGSASSRVGHDGDEVVVTAETFELGDDTTSRVVTRTLRDRFELRLDLGGLPFGLAVQDVRVEPDGVAVTSGVTDTVLSPPRG